MNNEADSLGACRAWGVEAKIGPSEDSFCQVRRLIAIAMGQEADPRGTVGFGRPWGALSWEWRPSCPQSRSGQFFVSFLANSYGYEPANPTKTVLAGANFRFDAPSPTGSYVQRFLYGEGRTQRGSGDATTGSPMRVFRRRDIAAVRVVPRRGDDPVTLQVVHVDLYFFYGVDIVLLNVEVAIDDLPLSLAQELMYRFGRAFPAGWDALGQAAHCLDGVEWLARCARRRCGLLRRVFQTDRPVSAARKIQASVQRAMQAALQE